MSSENGLAEAQRPACGRDFIATCYEVFLGRDLDVLEVADERGRWPTGEALRSIINCDEFQDEIQFCLLWETPFPATCFGNG